jgi:hypothetical protein
MRMPGSRRSDRVTTSVRLLVSGNDVYGSVFVEECRTAVVSRNGARIVIGKRMKPHQEVSVRVIATGLEADMHVIGTISETAEGIHYGMRFLDRKVDLWQIDFPPISQEDESVGKVLLGCTLCQYTAVVYLREFEVEVFEAQEEIALHCKHCGKVTVWKLSQREPSPPLEPTPAPELKSAEFPPPKPTADGADRRRDKRLGLKLTACIRTATYGDEVVPTENVSKGGFGFKSANQYAAGMVVEVAVPYSIGSGNIFSLAKITGLRMLPKEAVYIYGVCYLRNANFQH